MPDLAFRYHSNPIIRPTDIRPSYPGLHVECLLNPGVFRYGGRIGMVLRVAERPIQTNSEVSTPIHDPSAPGGIRILKVRRDDPDLIFDDSRVFRWKGEHYLTTLSHLRLAWSDDGVRFTAGPDPILTGTEPFEAFGLEDCRVTSEADGTYVLTYTVVSPVGVAVGCATTRDWVSFERLGVILPPHNKDCAIFDRMIGGRFWCLHRPSGLGLGGHYIWIASSPDRLHWGAHRCLIRTRPGHWDSERVGAGAPPIRVPEGWLEIYHGSDGKRYCLGALLLDADDPTKVLARSRDPIMEPSAPYEQTGFFGHVVFTNGHIVDGDDLTLFYGAADEVVCQAKMSIREIITSLRT